MRKKGDLHGVVGFILLLTLLLGCTTLKVIKSPQLTEGELKNKVSLKLRDGQIPEWARNPDGTGNIMVIFDKNTSFTEALSIVRTNGGVPYLSIKGKPINDSNWFNSLTVMIPIKGVYSLAGNTKIVWVEEIPPKPQIYK